MSLIWPDYLAVQGPFRAADSAGHIEVLAAGMLDLPSGKLGLGNFGIDESCDPGLLPVVELPPGPYQAKVSWMGGDPPMPGLPDGDVAAVHLVRVGSSVARWERHLDQGGEPFQFSVDHGIAGLFDLADAPQAAAIANDAERNVRELAAIWSYQGSPWFVWIDSILAFRCGGGDGAYAAWMGFDTNNVVSGFFLDLGMIYMPERLP